MLGLIGLSEDAETAYRHLLRYPDCRNEQAAAQLKWPMKRLVAAFDELVDLGLMRPSWDDPEVWRPVSPELRLTTMLAEREAEVLERQREVQEAKAAVTSLLTEYAELRAERAHPEVETLTSLDDIRTRLAELAASARKETMAFLPGGPQSAAALEAGRGVDEAVLARGVRVRGIWLDSVFNDPATVRYITWCTEAGGQIRTAPSLPLRMNLFDRAVAMVPIDPEHPTRGAVVLRGAGVVTALCALFEQVWRHAHPFGEEIRRGREGLTPQERELLALLKEGATDEMASRQLGVSLRTVRRMMAELMARMGARSRFQAGAKAGELGWL
jgi:sugar-specific transcriptional regulator TrmB/DNA-binding CsgD family transcriptional regulator